MVVDSYAGGPPTSPVPLPSLAPLDQLVPDDPWRPVRFGLMGVYGVVYIWWFLTRGLIIDRISVALSLFIFLVCAFIGRPSHRWRWLGIEVALYAAMWYLYEITRGGGDGTHNWFGFEWKAPLQVESMRNIDRFMFFGNDPNHVLQDWWSKPGQVTWYDTILSVTYFTHFVFPVIAMAALWVTSQVQWRRFMKRFATLLGVACVMFMLLPTIPPWMAGDIKYDYRLFSPLRRHTGAGFYELGLKGFIRKFEVAKEWGNPVAAMPSLHAGFALFVPAFFLPWVRQRWLKVLMMCFPLVMLIALVYFAEHWVIDALVGWAIVGASFRFWHWHERRGRRRRVQTARSQLVMHESPEVSRRSITSADAPSGERRRCTTVLLDGSFIDALATDSDPRYNVAVAHYDELMQRYERGEVRLVARAVALGAQRGGGVLGIERAAGRLAAIERLQPSLQIESAALALARLNPHLGDVDFCHTLVTLRRERIRLVASFDERLTAFGFDVVAVPVGADDGHQP
jgi:hypothetical protein